MKNWFSDLFNGILQNILASALIAIAIPVVGIIYAFSTSNPQTTLLVVVIILIVINAITNSLLLRQQRSMAKSIQELGKFKCGFPALDDAEFQLDTTSSQFDDEFDITNKQFDEKDRPQKLLIQFTNRGHTIIQVTRIKYSAKQLPLSALLPSYKMQDRHHYLIPFESSNSQVMPGENFLVEIGLGQIWQSENFNRMAGEWGYLRIEAIYDGKSVEKFTSI